jgi:hypothetical protein
VVPEDNTNRLSGTGRLGAVCISPNTTFAPRNSIKTITTGNSSLEGKLEIATNDPVAAGKVVVDGTVKPGDPAIFQYLATHCGPGLSQHLSV